MVFLFILVGTFDLISYHSAESKISFFFFPPEHFSTFLESKKKHDKSRKQKPRYPDSIPRIQNWIIKSPHSMEEKKSSFFFIVLINFKK